MKFDHYNTLIFDCDGVILDSNKIKTKAFYQAALPYGKSAAKKLVNFHITNGGISRYKKFSYFLEKIIAQNNSSELNFLLKNYASYVNQELLYCDIAPGLDKLRIKTSGKRWLIVSGGCQDELRDVFAKRGIDDMFDGGIFGSPDSKKEILVRELNNGNIIKPGLYFGDSKYDYSVSSDLKLDFIFISGWSDVSDWKEWANKNDITTISSIKNLTL